MSPSRYLSASLGLLLLGATSLVHAGNAQASLGIRLIIADSCDIHSETATQQPNGGDARIECAADTPYALSFSYPVTSADAAASQGPASADASVPEHQPSAETQQREFRNLHDVSVTTVTF